MRTREHYMAQLIEPSYYKLLSIIFQLIIYCVKTNFIYYIMNRNKKNVTIYKIIKNIFNNYINKYIQFKYNVIVFQNNIINTI